MSSSTPISLSMQWYQLLKEQDSPVLIYQMGKVGFERVGEIDSKIDSSTRSDVYRCRKTDISSSCTTA